MWSLLRPSLNCCNSLQRRRLLCSPIACLPPEILCYIFRFYLLPLGEQTHTSSLGVQSPFSLAQVCKTWRAIVESDPHLWTSICFYFQKDGRKKHKEDERRIPPIFDRHLKLSGTLPLSFAFTDLRDFSESTGALTDLLANRLREYSYRWKRISLSIRPFHISQLLDFGQCDLASLEHLYINDPCACKTPSVPYLELESATNLKSFTSNGFLHGANTADLHWGRLVEASFDFAPRNTPLVYQQYGHLISCRNMTTCSLGIHASRIMDVWQSITLPRLQTLRVRRLAPREADTHIFHFLILPQLKTLEIDSRLVGLDTSLYRPLDASVFSNLLVNSGCALHHLSIQDIEFSNEALLRCLALSPTLTSLCFIPYPRSQDIGDVIRKLTVPHAAAVQGDQEEHEQAGAGTGILAPGLREITLATSKEANLDLMMPMLRSRGGAHTRAAGVGALRRVKVVFFRRPWIRVKFHLRGGLKQLKSFRENLEQWASEIDIEDENEERCGGVVTKVEIR